jgi:hypothetical protein
MLRLAGNAVPLLALLASSLLLSCGGKVLIDAAPTHSSGGGRAADTSEPLPGTGGLGLVASSAAAGGICADGACAVPCAAPGTTACADGCVETSSDPKNCGHCGHDCLGATCEDGTCQPVTLAAGLSELTEMAVDSTSVYWTGSPDIQTGKASVMKVGLDGGTPVMLASGQDGPRGIAVDATSVYWVNSLSHTVMRIAIGGGTPQILASDSGLLDRIVVDAASVYWSAVSRPGVMKVAIGGGGSSELNVTRSTVADGVTVMPSMWGSPSGLALAANKLYWSAVAYPNGLQLVKLETLGGTATTLAQIQTFPSAIAADATSVYWVNSAGEVLKVALDGGTPITLASGQGGPLGIAIDATNIYWTAFYDQTVMKIAIDGGTPITLASGQAGPRSIVVDQTSVYWLNRSGGTVMKVAK